MIAFVGIQVGVLAQLTYAGWLLPTLCRPFVASAAAVAVTSVNPIRRRYRARILTAGAAVTATTVAVTVARRVSAPQMATATTAAFAVLFLLGLIAYGQAHTAVADIARDDGGGAISTAFGHIGTARRVGFPRWWAWAVAAAPLVTAALGAVRYPHLPATLAVGWDAAGHADHFAFISLDTVDGFVTLQAITALIILVVAEHGWSTGGTQPSSIQMAVGDHQVIRRVLAAAVGVQLVLCTGSLILWGILSPTAGTIAVVTLVIVAVPALRCLSRAPIQPMVTPPPAVPPHVTYPICSRAPTS